MSTNIIWVASAIMLAIVLREAIAGKQRGFARLGISILFANMVAVNAGIYGVNVSTPIVYIGLAVLAIMALVRIKHPLSHYGSNKSE